MGAIRDDGGAPTRSARTSPTKSRSPSSPPRSPGASARSRCSSWARPSPQPEAPLAAVAWEDHVAQLELFVKRPVLLGRALLPGMTARRSGRIVQVDAEVLDRGAPGRTAYATAKSAQLGLIRSWARALAPLGITVNTVAPALVAGDEQAEVPAPTRRAVAQAVSFVASDAAASVTGQRIVVDGGRTLVG